jgi:hypothetical protein
VNFTLSYYQLSAVAMDFADDDDFDLYENEGPGYFYVEDGDDIVVCCLSLAQHGIN